MHEAEPQQWDEFGLIIEEPLDPLAHHQQQIPPALNLFIVFYYTQGPALIEVMETHSPKKSMLS